MLEKIEIKGFRSFSQESYQKVELQHFTVIVGENDTGKSNLLKAIQFALNPENDNITREDFNVRKSKSRTGKIVDKKAPKIFIKLCFRSSAKLLPRKFRKNTYGTKTDSPFVITCTASGFDKKAYKKEYRLNDKPIRKEMVPKLLSGIKCFITPSIRDVNYLNELKELLPIKKSSLIAKDVKGCIKTIKDKISQQEKLFKKASEAQEVNITPILKSEDILKELDFDFTIVKDDIPIQLKNHGQGMISKIIISSFLKRGRKHIIGIEEPEIHMHPNLIREVIHECEKVAKYAQVIIVTHSNYLINYVPVDILKAIKEYLNEETISAIENNIKEKRVVRAEMEKANDMPKNKMGYISALSGEDISDTILNILSTHNDIETYKKLYISYGGHQSENDEGVIKKQVSKTIRKKTDKMVESIQHLPKNNELERAFKRTNLMLNSFNKRK
jgi:predicted ATP-dependent endonuclease of OLD family